MPLYPQLPPRIFDRHVEWTSGEFAAIGALGHCSVPLRKWSKPTYYLPEL